ncbi:cation:proton antiporter regulatory subunit [Congregibacter sp.]|uniref:cation:proton antiporter regulatory subunit n=1 Tax=Congregibacter sp. TaxID=2744308 RepID=UPI003F6B2335
MYVPEGSEFVGQSITDTKLEDKSINVLTLYRDGKAIPNPRRDRVLEAEDKLLCFGKLQEMRGMIPTKTRRKRRPVVQDLPTPEADDAEQAE